MAGEEAIAMWRTEKLPNHSASGLIRESIGPRSSAGPSTAVSPSRGPHHRHDPSLDGIGQAVSDSG